jgi:hypothetical protein
VNTDLVHFSSLKRICDRPCEISVCFLFADSKIRKGTFKGELVTSSMQVASILHERSVINAIQF